MTQGIDASTERSCHVAGRRAEPQAAGGPEEGERPDLTVEQILAWADAHRAEKGDWPVVGPLTPAEEIAEAPGESWKAINHALAFGLRGLPGDSSLAELLAEHRGAPPPEMDASALARKIWAWEQEQFPVRGPRRTRQKRGKGDRNKAPALTVDEILAWADAHHAATGRWPSCGSGPVRDAPFPVTWHAIDTALRLGGRTLPGGTTLARLLDERRRGPRLVPTVDLILAWADAYHAERGRWPCRTSGPVEPGAVLTWKAVYMALYQGSYGLTKGGMTLARLLVEHRGPGAHNRPDPLTPDQIRAWMGAHHTATGRWPHSQSGPVRDGPPGLTWKAVETALAYGNRGLPPGGTLLGLRPADYAVRPPLSVEQILAWADAHHAAEGEWPLRCSGPVPGAPGESWVTIRKLLKAGGRGLPGGQYLGELLAVHRGVRNLRFLPRLDVEQVLAWADAHHAAHGEWPTCNGGPVEAAPAPGMSWWEIDRALRGGRRGLPGGSSLYLLLVEHGRRPGVERVAVLTEEQILAWADAHRAATGRWPERGSGPVAGTRGEVWSSLDNELRYGGRGLPGDSSLHQLLAGRRGVRTRLYVPTLTEAQVRAWAVAHHAATGRWPTEKSGPVADVPDLTWRIINKALIFGRRGLAGGRSLAQFLDAIPGRGAMPRESRPSRREG
jgi:hypothetical protein